MSLIYTFLNQYHVVMEVAPSFWQRPESLRDIYIAPTSGKPVPLDAVVRKVIVFDHLDRQPPRTISGGDRLVQLAPRDGTRRRGRRGDLSTAELGLPSFVRGTFSGAAQAFQQSLSNEPLLVFAALAAVYVVLGMLYESYVHPVTILSTLPSAGVGALLAFLSPAPSSTSLRSSGSSCGSVS